MKTITCTIVLIAAGSLASASGAAAAPGFKTPMTAVRALVSALNANDEKAAEAAYVQGPVAIIDEFAPHAWMGPTAQADWNAANAVDAKTRSLTDQVVTLGAPLRVQVDGKTAYAVVRATFDYKQAGKAMEEQAVWTLVLDEGAGGWLIKAWSWGSHKPAAK